MRTKKKEFTATEKLSQKNEGFVKGKILTTAGAKNFERTEGRLRGKEKHHKAK